VLSVYITAASYSTGTGGGHSISMHTSGVGRKVCALRSALLIDDVHCNVNLS